MWKLETTEETSPWYTTDVKKITLMEQVADEYKELGKQGRFSKKCIPKGYIPDFDWMTIHDNPSQPIKPINKEDTTEPTTPSTAPIEVEGPPSSCLRSKTSKQTMLYNKGQPEHNPTPLDPPERNQAKIQINTVEVAPRKFSLTQLIKTLLWAKRVSKNKVPIAARCTFMVALAVYKLKCNHTVLSVEISLNSCSLSRLIVTM